MRDWLIAERKKHGWTMKEMGEKLNISESYYCAIEAGTRQKKMDIVLVAALANIFKMPISVIAKLEEGRAS